MISDHKRHLPEYRIRVSIDGRATAALSETICLLVRDLEIHHEILEDYFFQLLKPTEYDLIQLVGVVAFADRTFQASSFAGMGTSFFNCDACFTKSQNGKISLLYKLLRDTLHFLTGDVWTLRFVQRKSPSEFLTRQGKMSLRQHYSAVLPFSNGLDSFATRLFLKAVEPTGNPIAVTTWNQGLATQDSRNRRELGLIRLRFPFVIRRLRHPEPTYRSRTFVFYTLAALAAHSSKSQRVLIPENGQGSLGGSLTPFGAEWPHRGSHPGFTNRLGNLLKTLARWNVSFEHPHLWKTKAEVLREVGKHTSLKGWNMTNSCGQDSRHVNHNGSIHCGICTGCMLRRLAVSSVGLDKTEKYLWNDLNAASLEEAILPDAQRSTTRNDRDIAVHAILDHELVARLAEGCDDSPLQRVAFEIAEAQKEARDNIFQKLKDLVSHHRAEWRDFTGRLRAESWVRKVIAGA